MFNIPTPHLEASPDDIAKTVIMPGDPLRAKYIAENFLTNVKCFNSIRNNLGFTGFFNNKKISVLASGMGMPSIGIYSHELYNFYNVENIIRIGTAGALCDNLNLRDIVLGMAACTDSNYALQYKLPGAFAPTADFNLLNLAFSEALNKNLRVHVGSILSTDTFYSSNKNAMPLWRQMGVMAVEMEAAALYMNAAHASKKALCMLSISDYIFKSDALSSNERQESLNDMISLSLTVSCNL